VPEWQAKVMTKRAFSIRRLLNDEKAQSTLRLS